MTAHTDTHPDKLAAFCERWRVAELWLFGSVIRDDFGPESDVDVLGQFRTRNAVHLLRDCSDAGRAERDVPPKFGSRNSALR